MNSVEGLWLMRSTEVGGGDRPPLAAGIVVLETQRLFGGDSASFYLGEYSVNGHEIVGSVRSQTHTAIDDAESAFGMPYPFDHTVDFSGRIENDQIAGVMTSRSVSDVELNFVLVRLADLP